MAAYTEIGHFIYYIFLKQPLLCFCWKWIINETTEVEEKSTSVLKTFSIIELRGQYLQYPPNEHFSEEGGPVYMFCIYVYHGEVMQETSFLSLVFFFRCHCQFYVHICLCICVFENT